MEPHWCATCGFHRPMAIPLAPNPRMGSWRALSVSPSNVYISSRSFAQRSRELLQPFLINHSICRQQSADSYSTEHYQGSRAPKQTKDSQSRVGPEFIGFKYLPKCISLTLHRCSASYATRGMLDTEPTIPSSPLA